MSDNKIHKKLYDASEDGDVTRVTQLLKEGAQPDNYIGEYGETALSRAARSGHIDIAKILIEAGADVNKLALYWAAENGHNDIVKILREAGADVNIQGKNGMKTLKKYIHAMLAQRQYDLVTEVLEKLTKKKKGNKTTIT